MKRRLISILAGLIVLLNLVIAGAAQAQPLKQSLLGLQGVQLTEQQKSMMNKLESDILPQLESILTPEQRDQFKTAIADGANPRKAFKSMALTPDQKSKLAGVFKSLPKKDIFSSLTPEQKKELFMKKREIFKPSPEEISEKIGEKMKMMQK